MTWHRKYCWFILLQEKLIRHIMTQHAVLHNEMILRTVLVPRLNGCASYFDDPFLPTAFSCVLLPERVKSYLLCCFHLSLLLLTWLSQSLKICAVSALLSAHLLTCTCLHSDTWRQQTYSAVQRAGLHGVLEGRTSPFITSGSDKSGF